MICLVLFCLSSLCDASLPNAIDKPQMLWGVFENIFTVIGCCFLVAACIVMYIHRSCTSTVGFSLFATGSVIVLVVLSIYAYRYACTFPANTSDIDTIAKGANISRAARPQPTFTYQEFNETTESIESAVDETVYTQASEADIVGQLVTLSDGTKVIVVSRDPQGLFTLRHPWRIVSYFMGEVIATRDEFVT